VRNHPDSVHAGAIGSALWGAYRYERLRASGQPPDRAAREVADGAAP
jgi:benzoyl-CoA reductase subunit D